MPRPRPPAHGRTPARVRPTPLRVLVRLLCVVLGASMCVLPHSPAAAAASTAAAVPAPGRGVWPLQPRPPVIRGFDPPADPWGRGHRGVDLAGHVGQQVHAAEAGVVTYAGRLAGRGVVVVDHGSTRTTYEPVTATVRVGDQVPAGAVIGLLELFGSHCLPQACLHWGLIEGREHYLDPLRLVGASPVRLLPLGAPVPAGAPVPGGAPAPLGAPVPAGAPAQRAVPTVPDSPAQPAVPAHPQRAVPADPVASGTEVTAAAAAYALTGTVVGPAMALAVQARGWAWR